MSRRWLWRGTTIPFNPSRYGARMSCSWSSTRKDPAMEHSWCSDHGMVKPTWPRVWTAGKEPFHRGRPTRDLLSLPSISNAITPRRNFATLSENNPSDHDATMIQSWSKKKLAETTDASSMKTFMGDIALRLGRQLQILDDLKQQFMFISSEYDFSQRGDQQAQIILESLLKSIHNMEVLHRDTAKICQNYYMLLPADMNLSPMTPLLSRQVGQACKDIYARHALTIETMAELVIDIRGILKRNRRDDHDTKRHMAAIQSIVTKFLQGRLMTQLLCDHVVDCMMMFHSPTSLSRPPKPTGAISVDVNVAELIGTASAEACHLVEIHFIPVTDDRQAGASSEIPEPPEVRIGPSPITATLVRPWLQYTLVEMLKNSLAATMERNRRPDMSSPFYPILIDVSETKTHIQIQLHDQGGGLLFNGRNISQEDLFEFATRGSKWDRMDDQQTYAMVRSPIRGLGVGLALSRLHLLQFGGDLTVQDRPARNELEHGVTVTLLLNKNDDTLGIEP